MKLYAVIDNRDYIAWVEGIYSTEQKALVKQKECESKFLQELIQCYREKGYNNPQRMAQKALENYREDAPIRIEEYILDG